MHHINDHEVDSIAREGNVDAIIMKNSRERKEKYDSSVNSAKPFVNNGPGLVDALSPFTSMTGKIIKSDKGIFRKLLDLVGVGLYLLLNFALAIGFFVGLFWLLD